MSLPMTVVKIKIEPDMKRLEMLFAGAYYVRIHCFRKIAILAAAVLFMHVNVGLPQTF